MNTFRKYFLAITLAFLACESALVAAEEPDFKTMLRAIDRMQNFGSDFSATNTIITEQPGKETDVMQAKIFRRDKDDKFTIVILLPDTKRGQGYIQIEDNLWFYDPETRKYVHSSFKENFQSSNAKNSDFRKSALATDYTVAGYAEGRLGNFDVYMVDLTANNNEVTYPYEKVWISKKDSLLLKTESFSLTKRLMRTALFPSYARVGSNMIADRMLFIDEIEKGNKTQITLKDIATGAIPDYVFTKPYLEQVNK
jgi:outer membrane lipoprotein-sorting protein